MRILAATFLDALADLLWPPRCVACDQTLLPVGDGDPLRHAFCDHCHESVIPWHEPGCPRCGEPFDSGPSHLCGRCLVDPPPFDALVSALLYGGAGGEAVLRLKYSRAPWTAVPLGRLLVALAATRLPRPEGRAVIVPVPLHPRRLRERGFNQSALLARELARVTGWALRAGALERVRETRPRRGLTRAERQADLEGAFTVPCPSAVAGRAVVLVDDVVTTGATVRAAAAALREAGATGVGVACLARAASH